MIYGLPFVFFYNVSTGIFSALGDSKTPFYFLACSSTANIAVDILFVVRFQMGVAGVAWATFLCQGVSCVLALVVIFLRLRRIPAPERSKAFSLPLLKKISVVAVPSILQQSFISVGNILIQGVINRFGTAVMAGYSASIKLNNLVITSFTTLGNVKHSSVGIWLAWPIGWTIATVLSLRFYHKGPWCQAALEPSAQEAVPEETGVC